MAIVGRPNAGKSSLFNRLLNQERAIVTEVPGTTRDLVAETMEFAGIPVRLVDTAGIREGCRTDRATRASSALSRPWRMPIWSSWSSTALPSAPPKTKALIARARANGAYLVAANKCDLASFRAGPVNCRIGAHRSGHRGIAASPYPRSSEPAGSARGGQRFHHQRAP